MLRTVNQQLGAVQQQIDFINSRIAGWKLDSGLDLGGDWTNSTLQEKVGIGRSVMSLARVGS
jgi:hypothetical protein